jgi:hypothetical protein
MAAAKARVSEVVSGKARLEVLDGLRGYFLVFMLLNHLSFQNSYLLVKLNHNELSFVQDAQGFVFLSGLLIGMVYTSRMTKRGLTGAGAAMWRRALELFGYSTACIAGVLLVAHLVPQAASAWQPWLQKIHGGGPAFLLAAFGMIYQPTYMDILPQYIVYLLAAPPLLWLCVHGRWHWVAAGTVLLWLSVQIGLALPMTNAMGRGLASIQDGLAFRGEFNMLAWQLVFMGGMVLGTLTVQGQIDWRRVFDPLRTWLLKICVAMLAFFLAMKLSLADEILPDEILARIGAYDNRSEFSLIYLLNFSALAYVVGWLIVAGPASRRAALRFMGNGLNALFRFRFLRLLGRHSLQVYAFHVLVVYLLAFYDRQAGPLPQVTKNVLALLAVASLSLPALYREWRGSRQPPLARAPAGHHWLSPLPAGQVK